MTFQSSVPEILDRVYAINETMKAAYSINASRYFPSAADIASRLPLITAIPGNAQHDGVTYGVENIRTVRSIALILWVRNFMSGAVGTTAQRETEALIDKVLVTYWERPRLEIDVTNQAGVTKRTPLPDIMEDARIVSDTGIIVQNDAIATVRFTLTVETNRTIRRL